MTTTEFARHHFHSGIEAEAAGDLPRAREAYERALHSLGDTATWDVARLNAQVRGVLRSIDRRLGIPESPTGWTTRSPPWTDALAKLMPDARRQLRRGGKLHARPGSPWQGHHRSTSSRRVGCARTRDAPTLTMGMDSELVRFVTVRVIWSGHAGRGLRG
jgi:hypothetical protein